MFRRPFARRTGWRELEELQREMNRLFASTLPRYNVQGTPAFPAMNVWTNPDGAVVTAELPGIDPDAIDIAVVGETLTISGERAPDSLDDNARYHRRERGHGKFTRSFQLPFTVEPDSVQARFDNGVLSIQLPRAAAEKPRKIAVSVA